MPKTATEPILGGKFYFRRLHRTIYTQRPVPEFPLRHDVFAGKYESPKYRNRPAGLSVPAVSIGTGPATANWLRLPGLVSTTRKTDNNDQPGITFPV